MKKKSRETIEAEAFLGKYIMYAEIILNKLSEIMQMRDLALSITAVMGGERVQSSGTKSRLEEAVNCCIDAESEICDAVYNLRREQKRITEVIEQLDSPMDYMVLHDKYIKGMTHEAIAEKYGHDYTWSTTTHGRAVKKVWRLMQN